MRRRTIIIVIVLIVSILTACTAAPATIMIPGMEANIGGADHGSLTRGDLFYYTYPVLHSNSSYTDQ